MATISGTHVCDNSTLAHFQDWAGAIFSAFSTLGWTQTGDTGQASNPPASVPSSAYVYQIWKAADSQASTTPIYVKIEVGFSSTAAGIRVTVGTGSDGSGNITGPVIGPNVITQGGGVIANQGASLYNCYFSGDAGEFRMMMWQNNATAGTMMGIERSKDTSGSKTTDYVTFLAANAGSTSGWVQQSYTSGATIATAKEVAWMTFVSTSTSPQTEYYSATGTVAANPVIPLVGYPGNQMLGFCSAAAPDVAESNGTVITVNIYGANHSYLATKQGSWGTTRFSPGGGSNGAILMRFE